VAGDDGAGAGDRQCLHRAGKSDAGIDFGGLEAVCLDPAGPGFAGGVVEDWNVGRGSAAGS
jgi:hypothetical protein